MGADRRVNPASAPLEACDGCLRRAHLLEQLAPGIARLLERPGARVPGVLTLPDEELITVAAGQRAVEAHAFLASFQGGRVRRGLAAREVLAVCRHAAGFPRRLLELDDPPAVLFGCGRAEALGALDGEPAVAVVGTRRPSPYGAEVAYALGRGLGAAGVIIVSGMALGIDATSHHGCLDGGGTAVAVLACGPDIAYPRRHRRLFERIQRNGLVLSEMPPGAGVCRWGFPARNRIMAGLTSMTVVVEAADPSGSMITADFARDLGRGVAAVPGRITSRVARGTNGLLRDGAIPITGAEDVLDELFGAGMRRAAQVRRAREPEMEAVLDAVEAGCSMDEIARRAGVSAAAARAALGRLEAEGEVVRRNLEGWERAAG
jgi:DNA processing protein